MHFISGLLWNLTRDILPNEIQEFPFSSNLHPVMYSNKTNASTHQQSNPQQPQLSNIRSVRSIQLFSQGLICCRMVIPIFFSNHTRHSARLDEANLITRMC